MGLGENMKILVTGMNKNQVTENFYLQQQLRVVPSHYSLLRCLRDMGHTVEQRLVKIGEDLSSYDRVICFLASPRQALQLTFYNGLWAIHNTPKDKLVLAFDDWQTDGIFKGILSCTDKESLLKEFTINQSTTDPDISRELLEPHTDVLLDAIKYIGEKKSRILLSVFAGGDMTKLIEYDPSLLFGYNPNPYHRNRVPGNRSDIQKSEMNFMEAQLIPTEEEDTVAWFNKEKCFNFASLVQGKTAKWLKKQNVTKWKIEYFGSRKEKQRRLSEEDMCKVYAEQWGCLMPGYDHAGSGWWRARPQQTADVGSILICEDKEGALFGEPYVGLTCKILEDMDESQLEKLAKDQHDSYYDYQPMDKYITIEQVENYINE